MTNNNPAVAALEAVPFFEPNDATDLNTSNKEIDWTDYSPFEEPKAPEIKANILPSPLKEIVSSVSASTQTPDALAIAILLPTIATCVQGKYQISPYGTAYVEPLCLWTISVLPSGSRKSPVMKIFREPIVKWEMEKRKEFEIEASRVEQKRIVLEETIKGIRSNAAKSKDHHEREIFLDEIAKLQAEIPDEPKPVVLWTSEATHEAIQQQLSKSLTESLSVFNTEGASLEVITGLYSNGKVTVDTLNQAFSGESVRIDRLSRSAYLKKPALSLCLAVQPEVLHGLLRGNKSILRGIGFTARPLYFLPTSNVGFRDVRNFVSVDQEVQNNFNDMIRDLLDLPVELDADGERNIKTLTIKPDARDCLLDFSQTIEDSMRKGHPLESITDWLSKLPGQVARIAGLLHLATTRGGNLEVPVDIVRIAIRLAELLIRHAFVAFDHMGVSGDIEDAKFALDWIGSNFLIDPDKRFYFKRNLLHKSSRFKHSKIQRVDEALKELESRKLISPITRIPTSGKSIMIHYINPIYLEQKGQ